MTFPRRLSLRPETKKTPGCNDILNARNILKLRPSI